MAMRHNLGADGYPRHLNVEAFHHGLLEFTFIKEGILVLDLDRGTHRRGGPVEAEVARP